jgi:endonuclease-3 related protein
MFVRFIDENYAGSLVSLFSLPVPRLREILLELKGIGPETAESIILYAVGKRSFVVDAYSRRILERHKWAGPTTHYDDIKAAFEAALAENSERGIPLHDPRHPPSRMSRLRSHPTAQLYNEVHAVIVRAGNEFCRSKPDCDRCPLRVLLPTKGAVR